MRKLIFGINITLDGCCDHTKGISNEEVHAYFTQLMQDADLLVYGRKTYQLMVPFWPDVASDPTGQSKATIDFAQTFTSVKKVVFSQTLGQPEDKTTTINRGNLKDEILKLKQEPGGNILLGGVDLPSQLIELGLVDEFYFVVQPILVGEGKRLLEGISLADKLQLKLVDSKVFDSGFVALHYETVKNPVL